MGKGVLGLVVKPVAGALDMASSVTDGVANTASLLDGTKTGYLQMPNGYIN